MNKKSDLETKNLLLLRPDIAKEWNYGKNKGKRPENYFPSSHEKVWWRRKKKHEWEATIASRTNNGTGCPVCANRIIIEGFNDLATLDPEIAEQWDYEKNGDMKPTQISISSNKRVWWKCEKGHSYQNSVNSKTYKRSGCPICSNRKILPGYNDLATLRPDLAAELDEWTSKIKATELGIHSNKKVTWKCFRKHYWEARVNDRNRGTSCPYCAGRRKWNGKREFFKGKRRKK